MRPAAGVLEGVGERLLHDAIAGTIEARRQFDRGALVLDRDREAGLAYLRDEDTDVGHARLRAQLLAIAGLGAQDAEQALDVGERLPAGGLDRAERLTHGLRSLVEDALGRARLEHDYVQGVPDHVVQLPRQAAALQRDRLLGAHLEVVQVEIGPFAFDLGALACLADVLAIGVQDHAGQPDRREDEPGRDREPDRRVAAREQDPEDGDEGERGQHAGHEAAPDVAARGHEEERHRAAEVPHGDRRLVEDGAQHRGAGDRGKRGARVAAHRDQRQGHGEEQDGAERVEGAKVRGKAGPAST